MRTALLASAFLAGCAITPSWHLGETSEVIGPREVALSTYGGGGEGQNPNGKCCAGFGAKLRVGTGWRQEVGLNVNTGFIVGGEVAFAGGISYKVAPRDWLAVLIDVGGSNQWSKQANGSYTILPAAGSAFNLILTTPTLGRSPVRIFGAARFSWAVPLAEDPYNKGLPGEALGVPFGFTVEPTRAVRLVFEGGVSGDFQQQRSGNGQINTTASVFGWAAFTFTYVFRRK